MTDLLPRAAARGPVLARLASWHAGAGRRTDGALGWATGLAGAVAISHAVIFAAAASLALWEAAIPLHLQVVYAMFWLFVVTIAAGLHFLLTFAIALPVALAGRLLAPAPRLGALAGAAAVALILALVEPIVAWSWIVMAGYHQVPVAALVAVSALVGAVWGSWLPRR